MSYIITLAPERERKLKHRAQQIGKPLETILDELIDSLPDETSVKPKTGAEIYAFLLAQGVLGSYGDPNIDASELARQIRTDAEKRSGGNA